METPDPMMAPLPPRDLATSSPQEALASGFLPHVLGSRGPVTLRQRLQVGAHPLELLSRSAVQKHERIAVGAGRAIEEAYLIRARHVAVMRRRWFRQRGRPTGTAGRGFENECKPRPPTEHLFRRVRLP